MARGQPQSGGGTKLALSLATLALLVSHASRASAQAAVSTQPGFGQHDSFVLSAERLLGYQSQTFGDSTIDSVGFYPVYWSGLGLHGVMSSGLTLGAVVGVTYLSFKSSDPNSTAFKESVFWLRPRIGYAGTLQKNVGFWARLGPTVFIANDHEHDETNDALALGGEVYAVVTVAPHVGVLFGPHAEFNVTADHDSSEYSSVGMTLGLMGEFY
jgi:hypothetical protein